MPDSTRNDRNSFGDKTLTPLSDSGVFDRHQQSSDSRREDIPVRHGRARLGWRKLPSGRSVRICAVWIAVLVTVLTIGLLARMTVIGLNPDLGPEGTKVRNIANAASKHLSNNPNVVSTTITEAKASTGTELIARLKDDTSPDAVTNLLTSTHQAAFDKNDPDTHITLNIVLNWTLHGTDVKFLSSSPPPPDRSIINRDLATAGEAKTIDNTHIDYGQVTALPSTLAQPGAPDSSKTFTMNGWKVTSTSNTDGQFSNPHLDQVITTARQAGPTGTIELSNGTLSVTGLVTDDTKDLTPEAAAPVVHAVADCRAAKLTTLQLNNWAPDATTSVADPWLTFTCNNGTWTPTHDGSTGQDEATILNKATEL